MRHPRPRALTFAAAVTASSRAAAFEVLPHKNRRHGRWRLRPMDVPVLSDDGGGGTVRRTRTHRCAGKVVSAIAVDAAYIPRHQWRDREAADLFGLVAGEVAPSDLIFDELARLHHRLGDPVRASNYRERSARGGRGGAWASRHGKPGTASAGWGVR